MRVATVRSPQCDTVAPIRKIIRPIKDVRKTVRIHGRFLYCFGERSISPLIKQNTPDAACKTIKSNHKVFTVQLLSDTFRVFPLTIQ